MYSNHLDRRYNKTEKMKIITTLISYNQIYYKSPNCNYNSSDSASHLRSIFQVNSARNFGIEKALEIEPKPSWILPFDGNTFLPRDALEKIIRRMIRNEDENLQLQTIPMFRVIRCQDALFDDNYEAVSDVLLQTLDLLDQITILSSTLSVKQEGQIAFSTEFDKVADIFPEKLIYFKRDKVAFMDSLKGNYTNLTCGYESGVSFYNGRITREQTIEQIERCGYVIRLSYWPEIDKCEPVTDWDWFKRNIEHRPEVDVLMNHNLRKQGIIRLIHSYNISTEILNLFIDLD